MIIRPDLTGVNDRLAIAAALLWLGSVCAHGQFARIIEPGETLFPGTEIPIQANPGRPVAVAGEFVFPMVQQWDGDNRLFVLSAGSDGLKTLFDGSAGFPDGGGGVFSATGMVSTGETAFWSVARVDSPRDGIVLLYSGGAVSRSDVPNALATLGGGNGNFHYTVEDVTPDGTALALRGYDWVFSHFVLRAMDGEVEILAQESVTVAPGTDETFQQLLTLAISDDGSRVAFLGKTANVEGLYVWHDGTIEKVLDDRDSYPGSDQLFRFVYSLVNPLWEFGPDGTFYFARGTSTRVVTAEERVGVFAYSPDGQLELLFDNTTVVDGSPVGDFVTQFNDTFRFSPDGSAVFFTFTGRRYLRWADGSLGTLFEATVARQPYTGRVWLLDGDFHTTFAPSYVVDGGSFQVAELHRIDLETGAVEVVHQFGQDYGHSFSPSIIAFSGELAFFAAGMDHWMGPLSALDPGNPATEAAAFFAAAPDHAPWYAHPQYGWIFSESSRWPWIYSADAGAWLYVHGNNRFVLWMWSAQYGWILTRPPYWPWFWSADLREWRHWGDR